MVLSENAKLSAISCAKGREALGSLFTKGCICSVEALVTVSKDHLASVLDQVDVMAGTQLPMASRSLRLPSFQGFTPPVPGTLTILLPV
jgi:hypothetical protein